MSAAAAAPEVVVAPSWRDKGIWAPAAPGPASAAGEEREALAGYLAERPSLFGGSCSWPVMVLREDALEHNIRALAAFATRHGLLFAPHGKTTMAPQLWRRQIDAGAWGITVATPAQLLVARRSGVARVILANEVLDGTALDWIAAELAADPAFEFACFVDSAAGVRAIAAAGEKHGLASGARGGFPVLLDVGFPGGRTGVRSHAEARALADLVSATPGIRLLGVSSYEGGLPGVEAVRGYFAGVRAIVEELAAAELLPPDAIVTAGGSAYFDQVGTELTVEWARSVLPDARVILRSGAYISHDDGVYVGKTAFNRIPAEGSLNGALQLWAQVLSAPEAGLALVGMGKRDAPIDSGLPVPLLLRRADAAGDLSSARTEVLEGANVTTLDDHHGYVALPDGVTVVPGDLIAFGISHPCTAFDRWSNIPVVDADDTIVDVVRTYF
ncbi:D-serine deaminase-like pyridoxal phosphate-dependent protein [Microterricola gilva]|uniref:D-serine deaminase-like pyridoxal phosphate-dependent protein n=1 Tax=Microterricola gilva TaxID=393267 RepID=A0A4Q8AHF7_9MICO|nr:alanine racemase [Microterricola gilva]RZU63840.1 D-serine deaminase-like pyridoxal phosphate-dependent protein [Microterricola gilva]